MSRKELIREWLSLNIPFGVRTVANNAKAVYTSPFTSYNAEKEVIEHLTELLYESGFFPNPRAENLNEIGEELINKGIDANIFLSEDEADFHALWERKEFLYQAWKESQKVSVVDDKISSDYAWLGKVLKFLVERGFV